MAAPRRVFRRGLEGAFPELHPNLSRDVPFKFPPGIMREDSFEEFPERYYPTESHGQRQPTLTANDSSVPFPSIIEQDSSFGDVTVRDLGKLQPTPSTTNVSSRRIPNCTERNEHLAHNDEDATSFFSANSSSSIDNAFDPPTANSNDLVDDATVAKFTATLQRSQTIRDIEAFKHHPYRQADVDESTTKQPSHDTIKDDLKQPVQYKLKKNSIFRSGRLVVDQAPISPTALDVAASFSKKSHDNLNAKIEKSVRHGRVKPATYAQVRAQDSLVSLHAALANVEEHAGDIGNNSDVDIASSLVDKAKRSEKRAENGNENSVEGSRTMMTGLEVRHGELRRDEFRMRNEDDVYSALDEIDRMNSMIRDKVASDKASYTTHLSRSSESLDNPVGSAQKRTPLHPQEDRGHYSMKQRGGDDWAPENNIFLPNFVFEYSDEDTNERIERLCETNLRKASGRPLDELNEQIRCQRLAAGRKVRGGSALDITDQNITSASRNDPDVKVMKKRHKLEAQMTHGVSRIKRMVAYSDQKASFHPQNTTSYQPDVDEQDGVTAMDFLVSQIAAQRKMEKAVDAQRAKKAYGGLQGDTQNPAASRSRNPFKSFKSRKEKEVDRRRGSVLNEIVADFESYVEEDTDVIIDKLCEINLRKTSGMPRDIGQVHADTEVLQVPRYPPLLRSCSSQRFPLNGVEIDKGVSDQRLGATGEAPTVEPTPQSPKPARRGKWYGRQKFFRGRQRLDHPEIDTNKRTTVTQFVKWRFQLEKRGIMKAPKNIPNPQPYALGDDNGGTEAEFFQRSHHRSLTAAFGPFAQQRDETSHTQAQAIRRNVEDELAELEDSSPTGLRGGALDSEEDELAELEDSSPMGLRGGALDSEDKPKRKYMLWRPKKAKQKAEEEAGGEHSEEKAGEAQQQSHKAKKETKEKAKQEAKSARMAKSTAKKEAKSEAVNPEPHMTTVELFGHWNVLVQTDLLYPTSERTPKQEKLDIQEFGPMTNQYEVVVIDGVSTELAGAAACAVRRAACNTWRLHTEQVRLEEEAAERALDRAEKEFAQTDADVVKRRRFIPKLLPDGNLYMQAVAPGMDVGLDIWLPQQVGPMRTIWENLRRQMQQLANSYSNC